ncbi:MAG: sigma-54 dependent transcriptional regulator [Spirochaetia bacterium]|nr:sigma-54 dependent transcriptional regulator [Spirochaetia bacterium]
MFEFTQNAVGRLSPTILTLVIAGYLIYRHGSDKSTFWLTCYFLLLSIFNLAYVLGYSWNAFAGGYSWYLACAISFAAAARLQFAYAFPVSLWRKESRIVLVISFGAALLALADYALRVGADFKFGFVLHAYGSTYSSFWVPLVSLICFAASIVVSVRRVWAVRAAPRKKSWRTLWKQDGDFRATSYLIGITSLEVAVNILYLLGYSQIVRIDHLAEAMNAIILFIFAGYVLVHSSAPSGRAGFVSRLVGIALISLLPIVQILGGVFQKRDLDLFWLEKKHQTETRVKESFAPEPMPVKITSDGQFDFFETPRGRFYSVHMDAPGPRNPVAFEYAEYRARIHSTAGITAAALLIVSLFVLLIFPLLFRASLILPLRFLLEDIKKIGHVDRTSGGDEISFLQESFQKLATLLQQARKRIPDFVPHIEEMERLADLQTGTIAVGNRTVIYRSRAMRRMVDQVERSREFRYPVLITGETGTGKELAARMVHGADPAPFVAINCAALPEALWESEVFGHKKGAFTDARSDRNGRILEAGSGAVFFDEIGEMPLVMQAKLLRLLQENQFSPVGSDQTLTAACRFVFATNQNLTQMVAEKKFRKDLLYRIRVFHIEVPALRSRPEDIPELLKFFVERFAEEHKRPVPVLQPELIDAAVRYGWPGNIREMENAVVRAMSAGTNELTVDHFPEARLRLDLQAEWIPGEFNYDAEIKQYSRRLLERALELSNGNKSKAAEILGIKRTTLAYRLRDVGLTDDQ